MLPPDSVALCLRFREPDVADEPPDVKAFERRGRPRLALTEARAEGPSGRSASAVDSEGSERGEAIGVLARGESLGPRAPLVMFLRHIGYGIPAPHGHGDGLPDLGSWSLRPTMFGWLASVPPPPPRSERQRSRVAWIVAACLPLVLPAEVAAAPRPQRPPVQVPEPSGGTTSGGTTSEPGAEAQPEPRPASEAEAGTEPAPAEVPSEAASDPPVSLPAPAPALDGVSDVDQATIDAAWEGVDGFDVELRLKGGANMRGRVGAVQRDTFTLIQSKTGAVLVMPKSGVVSLRVATPRPLPARNGTGALVGGSILLAVGGPVFISGLTFLGIAASSPALHLPMLLIGGAALGGGIPLLVRGTRQRRAYQEAMQERALSPVVLRTPHGGWTGGLRFRF